MNAICRILAALGWNVTGSDQSRSEAVDRLRADGFHITVGHRAENVADAELVVVSTAVKQGNVELDAAVQRSIPVAGRPEVMEALGALRRVVAVSGTHGKTTTSAMATFAAEHLGWQPSFIVGGVVNGIGTGVRWTDSDLLVVEADESDNSFLRFAADHTVVTNIEPDHLDFHGDLAHLEAAFDRFVQQGSGASAVCIDDPGCRAMLDRLAALRPADGSARIATYGLSSDADYQIVDARTEGLRTACTIVADGTPIAQLDLMVPGLHNALNATGVFAVLHRMGGEASAIAEGLGSFRGVSRRFEFRGVRNGVTFVDDYAHLPSEVSTVLKAARAGGWNRIIAVFEPHRYTRIRDVGSDFLHSFVDADITVVTALYPSGQQPIPGVGAATVADAVRAAHPETELHLIEDQVALDEFLLRTIRSGDLVLTMNAGDLTHLPDRLLAADWGRG
jgi:UDP-N-acetylmuramate--alanine ligase